MILCFQNVICNNLVPNGNVPFFLSRISCKTAHEEKAHVEFVDQRTLRARILKTFRLGLQKLTSDTKNGNN